VTDTGSAGTGALVVGLTPAAAAAQGFAIKSDHCSGVSLAAGASCQVGVVLSAAAAGTLTADLTVSAGSAGSVSAHLTAMALAPVSLGAKSASLTVAATTGGSAVAQLSGTGITQGTLALTPDTHDFGSVQQMTPGASQAFMVKNTGQAMTSLLTATLGGGDSP